MPESLSPVALLFGGGITALGALRALNRAGVEPLVVGEGVGLVSHSRWYQAAPPVSGEGLEAYLQSLPWARSVLIPCSDDSVRMVAGMADSSLTRRFPSSLPSSEALDQLLDKGLFSELLRRTEIPHPRTLPIDSMNDLTGRDLSGFFLKPRDSQSFMRRFGRKAFWPESPEHFARVLGEVVNEDIPVVAQEYIPGDPSNHVFVDGFLDAAGRRRACFVRRRLRMYPTRFGNSSFMVSIARNEAAAAVDSITRLLSKIAYRGIFSAEFKWDARDGLFKLLEVNTRPWWFVEFAASCGVNVVEMAYLDALGMPVPEVLDYDVGRRFCHPYYDWYACRTEFPGFANATFQWLRSMAGSDKPVFKWSDPGPGIWEAVRLTTGFVARRLPWGRKA